MKVAIIMGSKSDAEIAKKAREQLDAFGIDSDVKVISAHRAPDLLRSYVNGSDSDLFIAIAGMAAHLAGQIAAISIKPVIAVPVKSSFEGLDALLSSVQMPKGVPVATVAVNGGANASILAAQILAVSDDELKKKLIDHKNRLREEIEKINEV